VSRNNEELFEMSISNFSTELGNILIEDLIVQFRCKGVFMKRVKHKQFSYNGSILLANSVLQHFYFVDESSYNDFEFFCEETTENIAKVIIRPHKITVLHLYISWVNDSMMDLFDEINNLNSKDIETHLDYIRTNLEEYGIMPEENQLPDFNLIQDCRACDECQQCKKLSSFIEWMVEQQQKTRPQLIHSTFHIIMLNKKFLRDFHERLADFIESHHQQFHQLEPEGINEEGYVKRCYWPSWLKKGIFFRDRGVCTICRSQLTGDLNRGIDPEIDHIVPLARNGTNDSSNLQTLCNACNNEKRHYSSATSSYDIPIWNVGEGDDLFDLL